MDMTHNVSMPEMTEEISARLVAQWLICGYSGTLMK